LARRFRRRRRGIWFPVLREFGEVIVPLSGVELAAAPLIGGTAPYSPALGAGSALSSTSGDLAVYTGQGHILKRIVGSVHIGLESKQFADVLGATVTVGIAVAQVDETGVFQNLTAWDPELEEGKTRRWLWVRQFKLSAPGSDYTTNNYDWPHTNVEYGDIRSGPHVDWKGTAKVPWGSRLFIVYRTEADLVVSEGLRNSNIWSEVELRAYGYPNVRISP